MDRVLTTWKEVAQYLGKGVRTAQRWEKELGLPVRRPDGQNRHIVLVSTDELDMWFQRRTTPRADTEIEHLRSRVQELEAENKMLREKLDSYMSLRDATMHDRVWMQGEMLGQLCLENAKLQTRSQDAIGNSRDLRNKSND